MKNNKRIGRMVSVLCLLCALWLYAAAVRAEARLHSGVLRYRLREDGGAVILSHSGQGSDLLVPDEVEGHPVIALGEGLFQGRTELLSISLPKRLEEIGSHAFAGCTSLKTLPALPNLRRIGSYAFADCVSLTELPLGSSLEQAGEYAFMGCSSLREARLPGSLREVEKGLLYQCGDLRSVTIGGGVILIREAAFAECRNLAHVSFPASIEEIGDDAFQHSGIVSADLGEAVQRVGRNAFADCLSLGVVSMEEGIRTLGERAFSGCENLQSLVLAKSLEKIADDALEATPKLQSLCAVPESYAARWLAAHSYDALPLLRSADGLYDYSLTPQGKAVIVRCRSRQQTLAVPGLLDGYPVESIGARAFSDLASLQSAALPQGLLSLGSHAFSDCRALEEVVLGEDLRMIEQEAFYGCEKLRRMRIPASVKFIGDFAFFDSSIEHFEIAQGSWAEGWAMKNGYAYRCVAE